MMMHGGPMYTQIRKEEFVTSVFKYNFPCFFVLELLARKSAQMPEQAFEDQSPVYSDDYGFLDATLDRSS